MARPMPVLTLPEHAAKVLMICKRYFFKKWGIKKPLRSAMAGAFWLSDHFHPSAGCGGGHQVVVHRLATGGRKVIPARVSGI